MQTYKRLTAMLLSLIFMIGLLPSNIYAAEPVWDEVDSEQISADVTEGSADVLPETDLPQYAENESVRVSIILEDEPTIERFPTDNLATNRVAMNYSRKLERTQDIVMQSVEQKVEENGGELDVVWNLTIAANAVSANVEYGQIEEIRNVDGVSDVIVETIYHPDVVSIGGKEPKMEISSGMTGVSKTWDTGYTGAGMRIAVIDTGLDTGHQSFDEGAFNHALEEDAKADRTTVDTYNLLNEAKIGTVLQSLNAYKSLNSVTAGELYKNSKVPFGFNYSDKNTDVTHLKDKQGEHGSHVAGIAAANRYLPGDSGAYVNALQKAHMAGNAPDAQVLVMKVFGKKGAAADSDLIAALEDALLLDCDTINMSVGSNYAGMTSSRLYTNVMERLARTDVVLSVSAGNNGSWAEHTDFGELRSTDVSFMTSGSPATMTNSMSVASVNNNGIISPGFSVADFTTTYTETIVKQNALASLDTSPDKSGTDIPYVFLTNQMLAEASELDGIDVSGKVVFAPRGGQVNFATKANNTVAKGAAATIIYNNEPGVLGMDLKDYKHTQPCISITQETAEKIKSLSTLDSSEKYYTGIVKISAGVQPYPGSQDAALEMSNFSSWGMPGDLSLKPEITAPGGLIYSVNGQHLIEKGSNGMWGSKPDRLSEKNAYELMSGTSMAAPQIAGIGALVKQSIKKRSLAAKGGGTSSRVLSQSLLMSTATPLKDENGNYYSVFQQGAGLVNAEAATSADSYVMVDGQTDGKVKIELGEDAAKKGVYDFGFTIHNLDGKAKNFNLSADVFTQAIHPKGSGYIMDTATMPLNNVDVTWEVDGQSAAPHVDVKFDFNGDGKTDKQDAQLLLDHVVFHTVLAANQEHADLNGDGSINTYDAHLLLKKLNEGSVNVESTQDIKVQGTIRLNQNEMDSLLSKCPNGVYIEAFLRADPAPSTEGKKFTAHSIPVLGFYGNWTDAPMFESGSLLTKEQDPEPYIKGNSTNVLSVRRDNRDVVFGRNPYDDQEEYLPERNAMASNGDKIELDKLTHWNFSPIRNAAASRVSIKNAATGEVYFERISNDPIYGAYYVPAADVHASTGLENRAVLNWSGTDKKGTPLPDGTKVDVTLTLAPELYVEGSAVSWDRLGRGASLTTPITIDNTAPKLIQYKQTDKTLSVTAQDENFIACVVLTNAAGTTMLAKASPNQKTKGAESTVNLDLSQANGSTFLLALYDYAGNTKAYRVNLDNVVPDAQSKYTFYNVNDKKWSGLTEKLEPVSNLPDDMLPVAAADSVGGYVFLLASGTDSGGVVQKKKYVDFYTAPENDLSNVQKVSRIELEREAVVQDMAYNREDQNLYFAAYYRDEKDTYNFATDLYRLNPLKGTASRVGMIERKELSTLAIDDKGNFYSVQPGLTITKKLWKYNSDASDLTEVFDIPERMVPGCRYSMDWDKATNQLIFLASQGYTSRVDSVKLYTLDPAAKTMTPLNDLSGDKKLLAAMYLKDDGDMAFEKATEVTDFSLSETKLNMVVGDRTRLMASVSPWNLEDRNVHWESTNDSVATVNENGLVIARGVGECSIFASAAVNQKYRQWCTVTVTEIDAKMGGLAVNGDGLRKWTAFKAKDLPQVTDQISTGLNLTAAVKASDNMIYATAANADGTTSTLYKIDPATLKETILNENINAVFTDLADAPALSAYEESYLVGIAGTSVHMISRTSPEKVITPSNRYADDNVSHGLVGIAYLGKITKGSGYLAETQNAYALVDEEGQVFWNTIRAKRMGSDQSVQFGLEPKNSLKLVSDFACSGDSLVSSAVYGKAANGKNYVFWSQPDGSSANLAAVEMNAETGDVGRAYRVGTFASDVTGIIGLFLGSAEGIKGHITGDAELPTEPLLPDGSLDTDSESIQPQPPEVPWESMVPGGDTAAGGESVEPETPDMPKEPVDPNKSSAAETAPENGSVEGTAQPKPTTLPPVEPLLPGDGSAEETDSRSPITLPKDDAVPQKDEQNASKVKAEQSGGNQMLPKEPKQPETGADTADMKQMLYPILLGGGLNAIRLPAQDELGYDTEAHTVTIPVMIENSSNGLLTVKFDQSLLMLKGVTYGSVLHSGGNAENGAVTIGYASADALNGLVANLNFAYQPQSTVQETTLTLEVKEDGASQTLQSSMLVLKLPEIPEVPGGGGGGSSTTPKQPEKPEKPGSGKDPVEKRFTDVSELAWYRDAVQEMVDRGLMSGVSGNEFAPDQKLTRGMLVTILHHLGNSPAHETVKLQFEDVAPNAWYAPAVAWAMEMGITKGYDTKHFGPNDNITREQLAVLLWHYAQLEGLDVRSDGITIPDFKDRDEISPWAAEAMSWAYSRGIMRGTSVVTLSPAADTTRAEAATMLSNYLKLIDKQVSK